MTVFLARFPVLWRVRRGPLDIRVRSHAIDVYWLSGWRMTVALNSVLWRRGDSVYSIIVSGGRVRYARDQVTPC